MSTPTIEAAHAMGTKGGPVVEAERLAFEAWMAGHCWALGATWDGKHYIGEAEKFGDLSPRAMMTRQLWAAWRDRAALSPQPAQVAQAEVTDAVAYAIHQVIKPSNMTDADWHSGAVLGHENEYREKVGQAATRAILSLRPAAVPMTPEQRHEIICRYDEGKTYSDLVGIILATEAKHGITAQAKKETP